MSRDRRAMTSSPSGDYAIAVLAPSEPHHESLAVFRRPGQARPTTRNSLGGSRNRASPAKWGIGLRHQEPPPAATSALFPVVDDSLTHNSKPREEDDELSHDSVAAMAILGGLPVLRSAASFSPRAGLWQMAASAECSECSVRAHAARRYEVRLCALRPAAQTDSRSRSETLSAYVGGTPATLSITEGGGRWRRRCRSGCSGTTPPPCATTNTTTPTSSRSTSSRLTCDLTRCSRGVRGRWCGPAAGGGRVLLRPPIPADRADHPRTRSDDPPPPSPPDERRQASGGT